MMVGDEEQAVRIRTANSLAISCNNNAQQLQTEGTRKGYGTDGYSNAQFHSRVRRVPRFGCACSAAPRRQ